MRINYHDYIKSTWTSTVLGETKWNKALHDGVFVAVSPVDSSTIEASPVMETVSAHASEYAAMLSKASASGWNLFYILKLEWVMVNRPIIHGYRNSLILFLVHLGIIIYGFSC